MSSSHQESSSYAIPAGVLELQKIPPTYFIHRSEAHLGLLPHQEAPPLGQFQCLFIKLAQPTLLTDILTTNQTTLEMLCHSVIGTLKYVTDSQNESGHHVMAKCLTIPT